LLVILFVKIRKETTTKILYL